jgi:hypothetical protein
LERFQDSRDEVQTNSATEVHTAAEVEAGSHELGKLGVSGEPAIETTPDRNGEEKLKESQDAPVTMASASDSVADASTGASRWTAVPVAMGSEETSMSLDHEMQKAYAAFAAADYATSAGTVGAETPSQESSSAGLQATIEEPAAAILNSEPAAISEPQPVSAEANLETPKAADLAKLDENAAHVVEFASPARNTTTEDIAPAPAQGTPVAEAATPSTDSFSPVADNSDPKLDPEAVKTSAAAWASWRQVRDTGKSNEEPEMQPQESAAPDSVPCDTAALAVAAGAEHALPESSATAPSGNPADVASIVDSVLADLRPKLMEEITRKMAEKKK